MAKSRRQERGVKKKTKNLTRRKGENKSRVKLRIVLRRGVGFLSR
jgi:hypothetical protein